MTSRERLRCALTGGTPDRVPVSPFTMGRINADSPIGRDLIAATDILVDVWGGGDAFVGAAASVTHRDEGDDHVMTLHTPMGDLSRRVRRTPITSATVEFPLQTPADIERFLSIPYAPPAPNLAGYREWRDRIGEEGLVLVGLGNAVCLPAEWFSPEGFCLCRAEAPDLLAALTAEASRRLNAFVETLCLAGVDAFRVVGGEYVSVQLGPRAFRELVTPFDKPLVDLMHRHGAIAYYHNHGRVMRYLSLLDELGIDALDPLEAPPWGDVADMRAARAAAGPRLCFVGNLDDMEVLETLPLEQTLEIARERLERGGPTAFVLGGTASGTYGEKGARAFMAMAELSARQAG